MRGAVRIALAVVVAIAGAACTSKTDTFVSRDAGAADVGGDAPDAFRARCAVESVVGGDGHSCVLLRSGAVRCWGFNGDGQLGDGTTVDRATPPDTDVMTDVMAIAAGAYHTCALTRAGGVRCWGENGSGQLGDGSTTLRTTPPDNDVLTNAKAIVAGPLHTCALLQAGGVRCWGANDSGQLGQGALVDRPTPPRTDAMTGAVAIATRYFHTCALTEMGDGRCWGGNESGQLGDGSTDMRAMPAAIVGGGWRALVAGFVHSCAITSAGGVRCWGGNLNGELGEGDGTPAMGRLTPGARDILTGVTALGIGFSHTCALTNAGGVSCWGSNVYGELGDGSMVGGMSHSRVPKSAVSSGARGLGSGAYHTCAVVDGPSGDLRCWGRNEYGQLGDGTKQDRAVPVAIKVCR